MSDIIRRLTGFIRTKPRGEDVRGSIADGLDAMDSRIDEAINTYLLTELMFVNRGILPSTSLNNIDIGHDLHDNGIYTLTKANTYTDVPDDLEDTTFAGSLINIKFNNYASRMQILFVRGGKTFTRLYGTSWEDWYKVDKESLNLLEKTAYFKGILGQNFSILSPAIEQSIYYLPATYNYQDLPNDYTHIVDGGFLITINGFHNSVLKILIGENGYIAINKKTTGDIDPQDITAGWRGWYTIPSWENLSSRIPKLYNRDEDPYICGVSANNLTNNGIYFSSVISGYPNGTIIDIPESMGWLEVIRANSRGSGIIKQVFYPYLMDEYKSVKIRIANINSNPPQWTEWIDINGQSNYRKLYSEGVDYERGQSANNFVKNGIYFVSTNSDYPNGTITDLPYVPCWFEVTRATKTSKVLRQMAYPYVLSSGNTIMQRIRDPYGVWSAWYAVGGGGGKSVTNNNYYTIQENSYNVTATPTITSGIPYVLQSTGNTADRTTDIVTLLSTTGTCYLGPGDFYVKNLTIPAGTTLRGSGIRSTRLRLSSSPETEDTYAVAIGETSLLCDLSVLGDGTVQDTIGMQHGVAWIGTYVDSDNPGTNPIYGSISNVEIRGFTGAGILCSNTSMKTNSGMNVSNVQIHVCTVGIYIRKYSEYHRFTNVNVVACGTGCENNGGNNVFVNCGFNSNDKTAFYINNTDGQSPNNSHGSCIGCTFNHTGSNAGNAIVSYGADNGYIFDGCQIHYGEIRCRNSNGIQFTGCSFGRGIKIYLTGGLSLFSGDLFRINPPIIKTNNPIVKSNACFTYDGSSLTL